MQYLADIGLPAIDPWIALGVIAATAITDAVCVLYTSAVVHRRDLATANWGSLTYMLSAFAVISFTTHWFYVVFASLGAWAGSYASMKYLRWRASRTSLGESSAAAEAAAVLEHTVIEHPGATRTLQPVPPAPRIAA